MTTKTVRKIVKIDEDKCDGCGECVTACVEGALRIIDGKARLVSETYCDGLGVCLGECPQGAITVEERVAEEFDEAAAKQHEAQVKHTIPCGCPGTAMRQFEAVETESTVEQTVQPSRLGHWPVQLTLVPPSAPFLKDADLLLTADCVPFAYAGFHREFLKNHALLVACPKLDDFAAHLEKLTNILRQSAVKSLTVVHMEVPCCSGLVYMARQALQSSGKNIPFKDITIGVKGNVKS
ncbi:MAG: 4Fe-4S binding protein [Chloroflexota bacterium]|nr:4Fe-4S binding protein [Chloroflexota bacterium]